MMRAHLFRWLLPIGLATATLTSVVDVDTAHAQRPRPLPPRDRGPVAGPTEAPPPIREERVKPRGRGWVWIQGHYDWRNGRWEWTGGRWEKLQVGKRWRPHNWENR